MTPQGSLDRQSLVEVRHSGKGVVRSLESRFLPAWMPLLLGLGLGSLLAFLIVNGTWQFAIAIVLSVPAVILLGRYPFAAILIWLLIFPFFVRTSTGSGRYVYWMLQRALIPATLGYVIVSRGLGVRRTRESIRLGPAEIAMGVFLGLTLANILLLSSSVERGVIHLYDHVFVPFCAYWLVRLTAPGEEDLKRLLWVAFFVVVTQATIGLLAWFAPHVLPSQWLSRQWDRTTGTFGNPAVYSTTLIFLSLLLFQRAMNCRSGRVRAALLSAFSLALFCVLLTFSRGSWLAGVVVLLGLILLYPRATIRLTIILAAPALFVGSSVLANEVAWAWERLNAEGTAQGRIILFNTGIRMAEARPLFGWGYGDYDRYDDQFKTRVADIPVRVDSTSHNTYLTLITELGLVAFLFYTLPLAYWMVASVKVWQRLPRLGFWSQRLLGMLWLVMIAHIIVSNFMDMIRFNQFGTSVWWIVLGFIANIAYPLLVSGDIAAPRRARKPVENT